jgi:hypothetical protein
VATEKQKRQQKLFQLKGSLSMAASIITNALNNKELSGTSQLDLSMASHALRVVIRRFNKDVGWKDNYTPITPCHSQVQAMMEKENELE